MSAARATAARIVFGIHAGVAAKREVGVGFPASILAAFRLDQYADSGRLKRAAAVVLAELEKLGISVIAHKFMVSERLSWGSKSQHHINVLRR